MSQRGNLARFIALPILDGSAQSSRFGTGMSLTQRQPKMIKEDGEWLTSAGVSDTTGAVTPVHSCQDMSTVTNPRGIE